MIYITKSEQNSLVLNINNNSRSTFTSYTLIFTHIMSSEIKSYTIDISNPSQYTSNQRYCEIILDLSTDDLNYEGQYNLEIFGQSGNKKVYVGMCVVSSTRENLEFIQYISQNENNENYIYVNE